MALDEAIASLDSFTHTAIHDMESFFWVLLFICLTRCGPGGHRRKELSNGWPLNTVEDKQLASVVFCLFQGDQLTLRVNKNQLLNQREDLEQFILPSIHPYFEPLKPLILNWWNILVNGFRDITLHSETTTYGYLYQYPVTAFRHALKEAMSQLPNCIDSPDIQEMMATEDQRRLKDLEFVGPGQRPSPSLLLKQQACMVCGALDRDFSPEPSEKNNWNDGEAMEVSALIDDRTTASSAPVLKRKREYR